MIRFQNSYAALPDRFYSRAAPVPVADPQLIAVNDRLAAALGLDTDWLRSADGVLMLAGNRMPDGADPIAQAYAGHQFGGFVPQLGDGRAHLLGEVIAPDGAAWDIQLKGSGRTAFSRNGDGRAWLGPVLREYVISEAMAALGIPTTRALAAVTTGEKVQRERALPGAILTRAAQSHLRVGTFQYFAARKDHDALSTLLTYAIKRHYPEAEGPLGLLRAVTHAQAKLIADWMGVGFIHGVMNTDNCHIGGLTIDYGPCAFMDVFHPATVFSSIDRNGRYAWQSQPDIALWNLAQLGTALLPLIDPDREKAVTAAQEVLEDYGDAFRSAFIAVFNAKLGLSGAEDNDFARVMTLFELMTAAKADFTNCFRAFATGDESAFLGESDGFADWARDLETRRSRDRLSHAEQIDLMQRSNPAVIPRNHRIEQMIAAAVSGDYEPFKRLTRVLETPFALDHGDRDLSAPPTPEEIVHQTFCGT